MSREGELASHSGYSPEDPAGTPAEGEEEASEHTEPEIQPPPAKRQALSDGHRHQPRTKGHRLAELRARVTELENENATLKTQLKNATDGKEEAVQARDKARGEAEEALKELTEVTEDCITMTGEPERQGDKVLRLKAAAEITKFINKPNNFDGNNPAKFPDWKAEMETYMGALNLGDGATEIAIAGGFLRGTALLSQFHHLFYHLHHLEHLKPF
jgi:hypothetical protein